MNNTPLIEDLRLELDSIDIVKEIASGSFKTVYLAIIGGESKVLKIIFIPQSNAMELGVDGNEIKRIMREIKLLQMFKSEFIVKLGGFGPEQITINKHKYIVYAEELLAGNTIRDDIQKRLQPSNADLINFILCGCHAIKALWEKRIIHRDIKPENIFHTTDTNRPYVLFDLGIAYLIDGTSLTFPGFSPGTLKYMAPEMFNLAYRETCDYRMDLYCLGVTAYEYASSIYPFDITNQGSIIRSIMETPVAPLSEFRQDLDVSLCSVIDQMIKKKPPLRPDLGVVIKKMEELK